MKLKILGVALILLTCSPLEAFAQRGTDTRSWHELELTLPLNDSVELLFTGELRTNRNLSDVASNRAGIGLAIRLAKHFIFTPNYVYAADFTAQGFTTYSHRLRFDGTFEFALGKLIISDRNRLERRLRHSREDTTRYRNKLGFELPLTIKRVELAPFVSDEVIYDFSEKAWIRNRFSIGVSKQLSERLAGEIYYTLQNERDSQPGQIHVIGTTLKVNLR